jgi:hypothetical protein
MTDSAGAVIGCGSTGDHAAVSDDERSHPATRTVGSVHLGLELGFGVAHTSTRIAGTAMAACVVAIGCKIPEPPAHSLEPCHGILLKGRGATTVTVTRFRLSRSDPGRPPVRRVRFLRITHQRGRDYAVRWFGPICGAAEDHRDVILQSDTERSNSRLHDGRCAGSIAHALGLSWSWSSTTETSKQVLITIETSTTTQNRFHGMADRRILWSWSWTAARVD